MKIQWPEKVELEHEVTDKRVTNPLMNKNELLAFMSVSEQSDDTAPLYLVAPSTSSSTIRSKKT